MAKPVRRPAPIIEQVESGTAELVPDPHRPGAWTLFVDDAAQSYVHLPNPTHLEFGYVRRIASIIDTAAPAATPLRVLHLGAGALTLPRYVAATRPDSSQLVIEYDRKLLALVRRALPLPDGDLKVRVADATTATAALGTGEFDLVIADVYQGDQTPAAVTTAGFAADVARVLQPGGLYAANILDTPPFTTTRLQAAIARTAFADVCLIGDADMDRHGGQRNVILAAATTPGRLPLAGLARGLNRPPRGRLLHGPDLDRSIGAVQARATHP
ncbi:spermidine synthase [Catellatospora chokoriensis]|uniref:Spermine/spermidine synthase n=1 Tax=Catellatospora chokoriensis TaxID=310353 RepID=A0A8J3NUN4_9ACTN|nr:fused MFS/spermidine synthase [Catellatospora chokoriensis]GIF93026.1 hypothetical protein Cch02nite_64700 [Catellatospora chokoriensis]